MSGTGPPVRYHYCSPFTDEETGLGEEMPFCFSGLSFHVTHTHAEPYVITLRSTSALLDTHGTVHVTARHMCTHTGPLTSTHTWEHVCPHGLHADTYPCAHRPFTLEHTCRKAVQLKGKVQLLPLPCTCKAPLVAGRCV